MSTTIDFSGFLSGSSAGGGSDSRGSPSSSESGDGGVGGGTSKLGSGFLGIASFSFSDSRCPRGSRIGVSGDGGVGRNASAGLSGLCFDPLLADVDSSNPVLTS